MQGHLESLFAKKFENKVEPFKKQTNLSQQLDIWTENVDKTMKDTLIPMYESLFRVKTGPACVQKQFENQIVIARKALDCAGKLLREYKYKHEYNLPLLMLEQIGDAS